PHIDVGPEERLVAAAPPADKLPARLQVEFSGRCATRRGPRGQRLLRRPLDPAYLAVRAERHEESLGRDHEAATARHGGPIDELRLGRRVAVPVPQLAVARAARDEPIAEVVERPRRGVVELRLAVADPEHAEA